VSLMSVGRLFQTSGPLTENARRPNCVVCCGVYEYVCVCVRQLWKGYRQRASVKKEREEEMVFIGMVCWRFLFSWCLAILGS